MQYRNFGKTGVRVSTLGFGCMRFPTLGERGEIDEAESIRMIRRAIDSGVNYMDTAYVYHGGKSEGLLGKALRDGYREKVFVATKSPVWMAKEHDDFEKLLDEQLRRLETDHIDMYLLHALDAERWKHIKELGVFKAVEKFKSSGKIKYIGFSFHDEANVFLDIVDGYDWDFCQMQFNYMDEHHQAGIGGLRRAGEKGIGVVIMEPLLGGKLAKTPPETIQKLWDSAPVKRTPAEWALRWIWNHPEVSVVLSGMSAMEQVEENLRIAGEAAPDSLTPGELDLVSKVRDTYNSFAKIGCTACRYCMPCPFEVDIPGNFSLYNSAYMFDDVPGKKWEYDTLWAAKNKASNCRQCGKCEKACPQKLPVRSLLKQVDSAFSG